MSDNESNNSLYFIVGGLVVVALVFGFMVWGPVNMKGTNPASLEPAAGTFSSSQTDQTKVEYDNDGGSKSITKTTKTQSDSQ